jgi:hypothetical protein
MSASTAEGPDYGEDPMRTLDLLENRRVAADQSMWQAPALTIAGQAFLLSVLTDETVGSTLVRTFVFAAGAAAAFAALAALFRLRAREVLYSEAIGKYCDHLGIADPRPRSLQQRFGEAALEGGGTAEKWLRIQAGRRWVFQHVYLLWALALLLFIAADSLAFALA